MTRRRTVGFALYNLLGIGQHNCEGISVLHEPHDPDPNRLRALLEEAQTDNVELHRDALAYAIKMHLASMRGDREYFNVGE